MQYRWKWRTRAIRIQASTDGGLEFLKRPSSRTTELIGGEIRRCERTELPAARQILVEVDDLRLAGVRIAARGKGRMGMAIVASTLCIHDVAAESDESTIRAAQVERDGILYFNPGNCGPRRFRLPVSIGELLVRGDGIEPRLVTLPDES